VEIDDGVAERAVAFDDALGDGGGLVGGVVEDLDLEEVARVLDFGDGFEEAIDDELLVKDGELDGDARELFEAGSGLVGGVFAVAVIEPDEGVTMEAISGQDDHDEEVGGKEGGIEGEELPVVEVLEGVVGVMGAEVVAEVVFNEEEGQGLQGREQAGRESWEHESTGYRVEGAGYRANG
jgi:hypothetical protein